MMDTISPISQSICIPDAIMHRSIRVESLIEANKHKWIESEKAGRDLGEAEIRQWMCKYWGSFLRERWLEHLSGKYFWVELDRNWFGLMQVKFQDHKELLDTIVNRLKRGQENLDVISWAIENNLTLSAVRAILEELDVNSLRMIRDFTSTS